MIIQTTNHLLRFIQRWCLTKEVGDDEWIRNPINQLDPGFELTLGVGVKVVIRPFLVWLATLTILNYFIHMIPTKDAAFVSVVVLLMSVGIAAFSAPASYSTPGILPDLVEVVRDRLRIAGLNNEMILEAMEKHLDMIAEAPQKRVERLRWAAAALWGVVVYVGQKMFEMIASPNVESYVMVFVCMLVGTIFFHLGVESYNAVLNIVFRGARLGILELRAELSNPVAYQLVTDITRDREAREPLRYLRAHRQEILQTLRTIGRRERHRPRDVVHRDEGTGEEAKTMCPPQDPK